MSSLELWSFGAPASRLSAVPLPGGFKGTASLALTSVGGGPQMAPV